MKKLNNKGFGVIEGLLILVIVGIIGGAGWYVYTQNNSPKSANNTNQPSTNDTDKKYSLELKKGYKLYEGSELFFQYPETWKQYELVDQVGKVYFESPDFKAPTDEGPGPTAKAGYLLEVFGLDALPEDNFENLVKNSKEAMGSIGGSYEVIKIDGNNAILSTLKTHGTYIDGVTFKNNRQYYFRLNAVDENKPEVKKLINTILGTVQFK